MATNLNSAAFRKRGRPRAIEEHSKLSTWVPAAQHDRLIAIARARDVSVSSLVKRAVVLFLRDDSSGPQGR